ncbi:hypothetical protein ABMA27_009106 [Loxostege sticticalis]|uniref:THAP-type domain-containing protein n=1 Tax=Loxostege sticticalis TaxID=481309 RepID=A0ABR3H9Y1_LOXSC
MVGPCVVVFCKNIGSHLFPKEESRRKQWIEAIKHMKPGLSVKKYSLVCSAHFKPTDFSTTPMACQRPEDKKMLQFKLRNTKGAVRSADVPPKKEKERSSFTISDLQNNNDALHFYAGLENYRKFLFISLHWKSLDLWVNKETVQSYMPLDFHDKFPSTRVVLDATECPIKKSNLPLAQQITFSSYKNRNTVKVMIGMAPSGLISYVSPCYGGSCTDRQIIERSDWRKEEDILDKFNYNDEIMVDKGLNVQDIFISYGVKVNMPEFFKKGSQIASGTLLSNRKIASKRVHVEIIIGMMKTYKILTTPIQFSCKGGRVVTIVELITNSKIFIICFMCCNFRECIMKQNK